MQHYSRFDASFGRRSGSIEPDLASWAGTRLLMLEHVGRTSGLRRYAVLEVVDHPSPRRYVVVSGFGDRAQWFRNVEANPQIRAYLGSRTPATATGHRLDADASAASLRRYAATPTRIPGPGRSCDQFSKRHWALASTNKEPSCP